MGIAAAGPTIADDVELTVDTINLSDHVEDISVTIDGDAVEVSAMSDTWRKYLRNRPQWTVSVTFLQDYYTAEVDATLKTKAISGAEFALTIKPESDATSATNEEASGNAIITSYPWLDGTFNDKTTAQVTFQGTGALAFATS